MSAGPRLGNRNQGQSRDMTTLELRVDVGSVDWSLMSDEWQELAAFRLQRARFVQGYRDDLSTAHQCSIEDIVATAADAHRNTTTLFSRKQDASPSDPALIMCQWVQSWPYHGIKVYDNVDVDLQPIRLAGTCHAEVVRAALHFYVHLTWLLLRLVVDHKVMTRLHNYLFIKEVDSSLAQQAFMSPAPLGSKQHITHALHYFMRSLARCH